MATRSVTITASTQATVAVTPGTIVLDPVPKSTTVMLSAVNAGGSSNALVSVQYSLDDPSASGAATTTWSLLSSAASMTSSAISANGLAWTVLSPIGQVRVNSTSGSSADVVTFTIKALQSVTG